MMGSAFGVQYDLGFSFFISCLLFTAHMCKMAVL